VPFAVASAPYPQEVRVSCGAAVGCPYACQLTAIAGAPPYSWTLLAGTASRPSRAGRRLRPGRSYPTRYRLV
jgi:hypothetical protein